MEEKSKNNTFKRRNSRKERAVLKENVPMFVMLAPFMVFFTAFLLVPIISSVALSFTSYDLISLPEFVGIDNYRRMFVSDDMFGITVKNTLIFAVVSGPIGFLLSFLLAWLVNEFTPRVRTVAFSATLLSVTLTSKLAGAAMFAASVTNTTALENGE